MKGNKRVVATLVVVGTTFTGFGAAAQEPPAAPGQEQPPPPPAPPPPAAPPAAAPPAAGPPAAGPPAGPAAPPPDVAPPPAAAPPPGPPPGAAPPPPPPPPPAPPPPADAKPADAEKKDEVKDGVRLRAGFSVNGGVMILPNDNASPLGPAASVALRIGVQFNHYIGLVYQNTPLGTATFQSSSTGSGLMTMKSASLKAGFADYNSLLLVLTLGHFFDIAAGPSLDFLAVADQDACASLSCGGLTTSGQSNSGIYPGAHGRVAFNIGGLSGNGPRRSGLAIGVDAHPLFTGAGKGISLTAGLGAEWY